MEDIDIAADCPTSDAVDGCKGGDVIELKKTTPIDNFFDELRPCEKADDEKDEGVQDQIEICQRQTKKAPTDFITNQDWSLYIKICCHLRQIQAQYGFSDLDAYRRWEIHSRSCCIVRLVAAFNRLYVEYSIVCDAVERERDQMDSLFECGKLPPGFRRRHGLAHRGRGDDSRSFTGVDSLRHRRTMPARLNEQLDFQTMPTPSNGSVNATDTCSIVIQSEPAGSLLSTHCTQTPGDECTHPTLNLEQTQTGCCGLRLLKTGPNSPDIFDCIQRQTPETSIWVKQIKRTRPQTILTTECPPENQESQSTELNAKHRKSRAASPSIRLPIALELTLPRIQRQVQTVMAICPFIFDPLEVIAELRSTNYDTDACAAYFDQTQHLRDIIQEFLPTRVLRPEIGPERLSIKRSLAKPLSSPKVGEEIRVFGMAEAEVEAFLLHYKQRLVTIRKLQKDAVRRIQRLHTFSSGLTSVMQQIIPAGGFNRPIAPTEVTETERNKELSVKVDELLLENMQLKETLKKEEERRKLIFNMMQEYLGNIRVFCRCRVIPQTARIIEVTAMDTVTLNNGTGVEEYKFDRAFDTNSTQAEIYTELVPLICSFMDGFNVSFLTYGGESSGKTYTLLGGPEGTPESQGVVYRALRTVLSEKEVRKSDWDIGLTIGVVEVYNDTLIDVISGETGIHIRIDAGVDRMLDTLKTVEIQNEDEVDQILKFCKAKRRIARTALNEASSRSHLIILVRLRAVSNIYQKNISSVLAMCDLAGFEDIIKADTLGDQTLAKEAGYINKSLTALNRVFTSLKTQNPTAVSYRDSKLTYLLKPFFTNSGKCILIVTARTDKANMPSTQGTLRFGRDSRAVSLGRARRQISMEKLIQDVRTV